MDEDQQEGGGGTPPRDVSSTKSTVAFFDGPVPPAELGESLRSGHRLDSNSAA